MRATSTRSFDQVGQAIGLLADAREDGALGRGFVHDRTRAFEREARGDVEGGGHVLDEGGLRPGAEAHRVRDDVAQREAPRGLASRASAA